MKPSFKYLLFAIVTILSACNNAEKPVSAIDSTAKISVDTVDLHQGPVDKGEMIKQLQELKTAFINKDKNKIADFLTFPLTDTTLVLFDIDSVFDNQRIKNGNLVTRQMFMDHFDRIYDYINMEGFLGLFKNLDLNDLKNKDLVELERHIPTDGCYYMYSIQIKDDEVTLNYGTNSNEEYMKAHPEEEMVCGESTSMWTFKLIGKKLKLVRESVAG